MPDSVRAFTRRLAENREAAVSLTEAFPSALFALSDDRSPLIIEAC
jgi:hypothetical protein